MSEIILKKSCIQETPNRLTNANSSTRYLGFPLGFALRKSLGGPSILGFYSTNGWGFMTSPFSNGIPRESIGWKKSLFTSLGWQKNKHVWKSLGCIMVNGVPQVVTRSKPLGACGCFGFGLGTSLETPFIMIHPRLVLKLSQNPPIQQNCWNFWTNEASFISFEISKALHLCNIFYRMTGSSISNRLL